MPENRGLKLILPFLMIMEIPKTYSPGPVEDKWYSHWLQKGFFKSVPDEREPYTIVIPPPNVTGVLHMGHMLNNTIQDVLVRRARMLGKNACWVPGTDHASIATEAKVVKMLADRGIKKSDLSRDEFLKHAFDWKDKYGGIILEQLKKLGASCDWDRTRFTMETDLSDAVIDVFIDLYNKGHIYRGVRMVNWDPQGLTAVSDEEVIHKEVNSKLVYVSYPIFDAEEEVTDNAIHAKLKEGKVITIATVRPETILGDTAVCVHPEDERYLGLKGKFALIPFVNRKVPIIFDDYIDKEFGTGALKVTPAHDINDYNLGQKHGLPVIDTLNPNGTMSEAACFYIGEDRFTVRKRIVKDLEEMGWVQKVEDYKNKVGYSERTDAVIEPRLSMQWFLKMETISKPALENVLNGNIKLIPDKFINTYKHWMENVRDWCISRQLWWGQQIPAWYNAKGDFVVCKTKEQAIEVFSQKGIVVVEEELKQDDDVVDTWFSSWLWPISVFDGFKNPDNPDIKYYYPTNDLVTAPEILFFWVARMIIAGYEYRNDKPFTNVYLTGIVRDKLGRKMSKSLGNSPDPLDLIAMYGADGVRMGMLLCSPAGNDLPFDESLCEQGRNFNNKIWNAFRLIKSWEVDPQLAPSENATIASAWFRARLQEKIEEINQLFDKYRLSDALMTTYKLVWDDFCSWYLEMVKPDYVDGKAKAIPAATLNETIHIFEDILRLIHPFMPFISEELWHLIKDRNESDCLMVNHWPSLTKGEIDLDLIQQFNHAAHLIQEIRNIRNQKSISPKIALALACKIPSSDFPKRFESIIQKLANVSEIKGVEDKLQGALTIMINKTEYFLSLGMMINKEEEQVKIEGEIKYLNGFLESVDKKLLNQKFVANAKPEVIELENKKKNDALQKLKILEEQLMALK
jgi:valyl-tRNA synthetase